MANRHWTTNSQRSVSSKGHGPAYGRDGGKVLNDTETQPKYNENIGPDGPDLNRVNFATVKAHVKARFMILEGGTPIAGAGQGGGMAEMIGKIGGAIGSSAGSMDTGKTPAQSMEPGHNSGSAPVTTEFSPTVRRSR